jgi:DeoR family glycerol-3-phosphate regulon repressor
MYQANKQSQRQQEIMQALQLKGSCGIGELASRFSVSEETIRRDVRRLEQLKLIRKVHGGILLPDEKQQPSIMNRMSVNQDAKQVLARLAAEQVKDGDSIMLDSGSTCVYIAKALTNRQNLFVVTNSTDIQRILIRVNSNSVYLAGGESRLEDGGTFGPYATHLIRQFAVKTAFISLGAIHPNYDFMTYHPWEAELAQAMIEQSEQRIFVADHTKFGRRGVVKVCAFSEADMLVTNRLPPEEYRQELNNAGVQVLTPDTD